MQNNIIITHFYFNLTHCFKIVFIALFLFGSAPAFAASPAPLLKIVRPFMLGLPAECIIGKDCWVLNYPDAGPDSDKTATDPACGVRTYEGHKGTDIAIADKAAMDRGVNVLAAHEGTVMRVRNAEEDHFPVTKEQLDKIKADKKECGNAVLIDHGDGWQTMYCHMKRGSIVVKPQQKIKAGEKIGLIGASGMTQFPHIHLGVIHKSDVIDPFTGAKLTEPCGGKSASLFEKSAHVIYEPLVFMKTGFDTKPVTLDDLDRGIKSPEDIASDASALVFYAVMLGVRQGDEISLKIESPDGSVFSERNITEDKSMARRMLFIGRNIPKDVPLPSGVYTGKIDVLRKEAGKEDQKFSHAVAVRVE